MTERNDEHPMWKIMCRIDDEPPWQTYAEYQGYRYGRAAYLTEAAAQHALSAQRWVDDGNGDGFESPATYWLEPVTPRDFAGTQWPQCIVLLCPQCGSEIVSDTTLPFFLSPDCTQDDLRHDPGCDAPRSYHVLEARKLP